jgi:site-specific DNA-methyltransferase (adenine-specific)
MITATNEDNMLMMARYPDNYFDVAIVDPPYGIDVANDSRSGKSFKTNFGGKSKMVKARSYKKSDWDKTPPEVDYFNELIRVSKNQIIWGANHFCNLFAANSTAWIIWDKDNGESNLADAEIAYSSFEKSVRIFSFKWHGMLQGDMKKKEVRIHPTQKPVKLYEWLLMNYAKEGDKILDTHLGSGSIAIACHNLGFDLTACELDKDYYDAAMKRLKQHQQQLTMF